MGLPTVKSEHIFQYLIVVYFHKYSRPTEMYQVAASELVILRHLFLFYLADIMAQPQPFISGYRVQFYHTNNFKKFSESFCPFKNTYINASGI